MKHNDTVESELQVCARLLRALAHRVRGDLSVITNDLAYLATVVSPTEVERARARCGRISTALAHISAIGVSNVKASTPLPAVTKIFGIPEVAPGHLNEVRVAASNVLLGQAAELLRELLGEWDGCVCGEGIPESIAILLKGRAADDNTGEYRSVSAYAVAQVGEGSAVEAGLVDLILRDHGWAVAVVCEDRRATIQLTVPSLRE